ncbi:MAG: GyrI-like domain-containing protein [Pseudomonadota bacterium]
MDVERKILQEQHYLYVDRQCEYGPKIGEAMGSAFGEVFTFNAQHGIAPISMPMTVYLEMDPRILRFRSGFLVTAEDAAKASGNVNAATLPAGDVMTTIHVGPYDCMNETHKALWQLMEAEGIACAMPIWEIYVDDPERVEPSKVRTEIYRKVG